MAARLELGDDFAHALQRVAVRDEQGVGRVDDGEILDADGRDDAVAGMDKGIPGGDGDALALAAIAVGIRRGELRHRLPRADIGPVERSAHDRHFARRRGRLHHRVVERDVGHGREQVGVDLQHRGVGRARRVRAALHRARAAAAAWRASAARIADAVKQNMPGVPDEVSGRDDTSAPSRRQAFRRSGGRERRRAPCRNRRARRAHSR